MASSRPCFDIVSVQTSTTNFPRVLCSACHFPLMQHIGIRNWSMWNNDITLSGVYTSSASSASALFPIKSVTEVGTRTSVYTYSAYLCPSVWAACLLGRITAIRLHFNPLLPACLGVYDKPRPQLHERYTERGLSLPRPDHITGR